MALLPRPTTNLEYSEMLNQENYSVREAHGAACFGSGGPYMSPVVEQCLQALFDEMCAYWYATPELQAQPPIDVAIFQHNKNMAETYTPKPPQRPFNDWLEAAASGVPPIGELQHLTDCGEYGWQFVCNVRQYTELLNAMWQDA